MPTCSRRWMITLILLVTVLSACGLNTSGEPKIVNEQEIRALQVTNTPVPPTPAPTAAATEEAVAPEATDAAPAATAEVTGDGDQPVAGELPGDVMRGRDLYIQECAACHGAQESQNGPSLGGMGERAATRIEGMSAAAYLHESIINPSAYVVEGFEDIMPKDYGQRLSEDDINSLVKFILEFTPELMMGGAASGDQQPGAPSGEGHAGTLTLSGKVVPGTAGADPVPAGTEVDLFVMNFMIDPRGHEVGSYTATTDENGAYTFENVARQPGNVYILEMDYAGVRQWQWSSEIEGSEESLTLDIPVYERSTDTSKIVAMYSEILISYEQVSRGMLEVQWYVSLRNTSEDQIVSTDQTADDGRPITARFELPVGATGIQFVPTPHSGSYRDTLENGVPVVLDVWPLRPGETRETVMRFLLPYDESAVLDQALGFQVLSASVMVPNDTVRFESDQFDTTGQLRYRRVPQADGSIEFVELQPGEQVNEDDPALIRAYELIDPLDPGERLIFSLEGRPTRAAAAEEEQSKTDVLPFILAAAGVLLLGAAGLLWWRQRVAAAPLSGAAGGSGDDWEPPTGKSDLLRAMAALDDDYEAGRIDEETYRERRAILKDRLLPLMDEE